MKKTQTLSVRFHTAEVILKRRTSFVFAGFVDPIHNSTYKFEPPKSSRNIHKTLIKKMVLLIDFIPKDDNLIQITMDDTRG